MVTIDPQVQAAINARNALLAENLLWSQQHPVTQLTYADNANKSQSQIMAESLALRSNAEALWNQTHASNQPYYGDSATNIFESRLEPYKNSARYNDLLQQYQAQKYRIIGSSGNLDFNPATGKYTYGAGYSREMRGREFTPTPSPVAPASVLNIPKGLESAIGGAPTPIQQYIKMTVPQKFDPLGDILGFGSRLVRDINPFIATAAQGGSGTSSAPQLGAPEIPQVRTQPISVAPAPSPLDAMGETYSQGAARLGDILGTILGTAKAAAIDLNPVVNPLGAGRAVLDTAYAAATGRDVLKPITDTIDATRIKVKGGVSKTATEGFDIPGLGHFYGDAPLIEAQQREAYAEKKLDYQNQLLKADPKYVEAVNKQIEFEDAFENKMRDFVREGKIAGGTKIGDWKDWQQTPSMTNSDVAEYNKIINNLDATRQKVSDMEDYGVDNKGIVTARHDLLRARDEVGALQEKNRQNYWTTQGIPGVDIGGWEKTLGIKPSTDSLSATQRKQLGNSTLGATKEFLDWQEGALEMGTGWMPEIFGDAGSFAKGATKMGVYALNSAVYPVLQVVPLAPSVAEMAIRNPSSLLNYAGEAVNVAPQLSDAEILGFKPLKPIKEFGKSERETGAVGVGLAAPFMAPITIGGNILSGKPVSAQTWEEAGALAAMLGAHKTVKATGALSSPITSRIPLLREAGFGGTIRNEKLATGTQIKYSDLGIIGEGVTKPFKYIPKADLVYNLLTGKELKHVTGAEVRPEMIEARVRVKAPTIPEALRETKLALTEGGIGSLLGFEQRKLPALQDIKVESGKVKGLRSSSALFPKSEVTAVKDAWGGETVTERPFIQNKRLFDQDSSLYKSMNPKIYPKSIPSGQISDWSGQLISPTAKISETFHHTNSLKAPKEGVWLTEAEHTRLHKMQNGEIPIESEFFNRYADQGWLKKKIGANLLSVDKSPFWEGGKFEDLEGNIKKIKGDKLNLVLESELEALGSAPSRKFKGQPTFLTKFIEREGYTPGAADMYIGTELQYDLLKKTSTPQAIKIFEEQYKRLQDIERNTLKPENIRDPAKAIDQMDIPGIKAGDGKIITDIIKKYDHTLTGSLVEAITARLARKPKDLDILTDNVKEMTNDLVENYFNKRYGKDKVSVEIKEDSASIAVFDPKENKPIKRADIHTHAFGGRVGQKFQYGLDVVAPIKVKGLNIMDLKEQRLRKVASTMGLRKSTEGDWISTAQLDTRFKDIGDQLTGIKSEMLAKPKRATELQETYDILGLQVKEGYPIPTDKLKIAQETLKKAEAMPLGEGTFVRLPATKRYIHLEGLVEDAGALKTKTVEGVKQIPTKVSGKAISEYDTVMDILGTQRVKYAEGGIQEVLARTPFQTKEGYLLNPEVTKDLVSQLENNGNISGADAVRKTTIALEELIRSKNTFRQKSDFAFDHPELQAATSKELLRVFSTNFRDSVKWYGSKAFTRFFEKDAFRDTSKSDFDGYVNDKALNNARSELKRIAKMQNDLVVEFDPKSKTVSLFKKGNKDKPIVELHASSEFKAQSKLPTTTMRTADGRFVRTIAPEVQLAQVFDGMFRKAVLDPSSKTVSGLFVKKLKYYGDAIAGLRQGAADIYGVTPTVDVFGIRRGKLETKARKLSDAATAIEKYYNDPKGIERDIGISKDQYADLMKKPDFREKVKSGKIEYKDVPWTPGELAKRRASTDALINPIDLTSGKVGKPLIDITGRKLVKGGAVVGALALTSAVMAQPASALSIDEEQKTELNTVLGMLGIGLVGGFTRVKGIKGETISWKSIKDAQKSGKFIELANGAKFRPESILRTLAEEHTGKGILPGQETAVIFDKNNKVVQVIVGEPGANRVTIPKGAIPEGGGNIHFHVKAEGKPLITTIVSPADVSGTLRMGTRNEMGAIKSIIQGSQERRLFKSEPKTKFGILESIIPQRKLNFDETKLVHQMADRVYKGYSGEFDINRMRTDPIYRAQTENSMITKISDKVRDKLMEKEFGAKTPEAKRKLRLSKEWGEFTDRPEIQELLFDKISDAAQRQSQAYMAKLGTFEIQRAEFFTTPEGIHVTKSRRFGAKKEPVIQQWGVIQALEAPISVGDILGISGYRKVTPKPLPKTSGGYSTTTGQKQKPQIQPGYAPLEEQYPRSSELGVVEDAWGYKPTTKREKESGYTKPTPTKKERYPEAYTPISISEIIGYTPYKEGRYSEAKYPILGQYPTYDKYNKGENYQKYSQYEKYQKYPEYAKYPDYSKYAEYPQYPEYPKYPEYAKYPDYSKYAEYPQYPEYPKYPKYNKYEKTYEKPYEQPFVERTPSEDEGITGESGIQLRKRHHYEAAPGAMPEEVSDILFGSEAPKKKVKPKRKKMSLTLSEPIKATKKTGEEKDIMSIFKDNPVYLVKGEYPANSKRKEHRPKQVDIMHDILLGGSKSRQNEKKNSIKRKNFQLYI